jgi:hypothetical protein
MKKRIILVSITVALFLAHFAGGVFAVDDHQTVAGQKLVGVEEFGTLVFTETHEMNLFGAFFFTNPDCEEEITITQVSIIRQDTELGPTLVYEGPFIHVSGDEREVIDRPMEPHETWSIPLFYYMYIGPEYPTPEDLIDPDNWLSDLEATYQPLEVYTVEIAWEGKGLPLIGWHFAHFRQSEDGEVYVGRQESPMVNMTQGKK